MKTSYDPSKCKNWDKPYGAERFIEEKYPYRPQIIFIENYVETTVFDSKIGGIPYMPADFEYPTVKDGKDKGEPIPFLAQINFRKAPRLTGFPTHGIMQFYCYKDSFYNEFSKQQLEHIKQERYRVIYFPEPDEDDVLKKEEDFPKINLESLCRSECRLDAQYPAFSHISLEDRSIRHSLCPYFNCASVESFEDRINDLFTSKGGEHMIFYTGDTHGKITKITNAIRNSVITANDTIVILGDAGFNYYGNDSGDRKTKFKLNEVGVTVFCIHGNHEMRPETIPLYITKTWNGGIVFYEEKYPNILFANDGEIYDLDGKKSIVIGGAYSVDKYYRLRNGFHWFADEQPSEETKTHVEAVLESCNWNIDQVLTHTCPLKYIPTEAFMPSIDQKTVDRSTEEWLDAIEEKLTYQRWLCGHWHIDKSIDDFRFVMNDIII